MTFSDSEMQTDLFTNIPSLTDEKEPEICSCTDSVDLWLERFLAEGLSRDTSFHLKTEACILNLAHAHNKILSLSNSRTRILAHQVESTYRIVNAFKHRFLVADEVGLGKTVEAGLVIKELIYRYGYRRILVACPASLIYQWQSELKSKFNEDFMILNRREIERLRNKCGPEANPWQYYQRIICSLDFLKNPKFADDIDVSRWDAVIFDEAHRLRRDARQSTLVYGVAERISRRTKALLLLTATPFRGKLEELYYLITLLDEHALGPISAFQRDYCCEQADLESLKAKINPYVIRRTKREIGGFTKRVARTVRFELYPDELYLYEQTTEYVVREFNRAMQQENRAVGFVMTVFQKLLDSSSHALKIALQRRRQRLQQILDSGEALQKFTTTNGAYAFDDETDEMEDTENLPADYLAACIDELLDEIKTLDTLVSLAEKIERNKKGEKLCELIERLKKRGCKKFLIFTQFMTTQRYLEGLLSDYSWVSFNGSMTGDQKEDAIRKFQEDAEICIATEAGGEGRNMQFCNVCVNYDLPWSPLKIEQRIGRLHRFGQRSDVYIYNFSTRGTVAERVLEVLTDKIRIFEESIGTPDVMLGDIEDELNFNKLIMDMVTGKKQKRDIEENIGKRVEMARESYQKLRNLTVAERLDFNYDEYYRVTMKERSITNARIERFISKLNETDFYDRIMIGKRNGRTGLYPVKTTTSEGKLFLKQGTFDSKMALEREHLEFLACGHGAVDSSIELCLSEEFPGRFGFMHLDIDLPWYGMLFNFVFSFESDSTRSEFCTIAVPSPKYENQCELREIEEEALAQNFDTFCADTKGYDHIFADVFENAQWYFRKAFAEAEVRLNRRKKEFIGDIDLFIDPELDRIRNDYRQRIIELEEKKERQEAQMKWYGKDMRSVITRTHNQISRLRSKEEQELKRCRSRKGITGSMEMLNCAVVGSINR